MDAWYLLLLIPALILLVVAIFWRVGKDREEDKNLEALWKKLRAEVLEVSLLASKHCPSDVEAHNAVIEAAQCLVFPKVGPHTIVSAAMVEARYKQGFAHLDRARVMSAGVGT